MDLTVTGIPFQTGRATRTPTLPLLTIWLPIFKVAWLVLMNGCMHKTYFHLIAIMLPLAALVAAAINKLKVQVPVGYQDENGFHVGAGRTENKVNWPPFW